MLTSLTYLFRIDKRWMFIFTFPTDVALLCVASFAIGVYSNFAMLISELTMLAGVAMLVLDHVQDRRARSPKKAKGAPVVEPSPREKLKILWIHFMSTGFAKCYAFFLVIGHIFPLGFQA